MDGATARLFDSKSFFDADWWKKLNGKIIPVAYLRSYKADESNDTGYSAAFYRLCFLEISGAPNDNLQ